MPFEIAAEQVPQSPHVALTPPSFGPHCRDLRRLISDCPVVTDLSSRTETSLYLRLPIDIRMDFSPLTLCIDVKKR